MGSSKYAPAEGHVLTSSYAQVVGHHCFGCGPDNRCGMRLRFTADEAARTVACRVRLPRRFEGPPGHAHGGIVATILDEAMVREVIPKLKAAGATGIVEYPLSKVVI